PPRPATPRGPRQTGPRCPCHRRRRARDHPAPPAPLSQGARPSVGTGRGGRTPRTPLRRSRSLDRCRCCSCWPLRYLPLLNLPLPYLPVPYLSSSRALDRCLPYPEGNVTVATPSRPYQYSEWTSR